MPGLALTALLFASWSLALAGTAAWLDGRPAVAVLALGVAVLGLGECLYDSVQGPLVADLAPEGAAGRYYAVSGFSWQLGFIVAPAAGGGRARSRAVRAPAGVRRGLPARRGARAPPRAVAPRRGPQDGSARG
jgi:MFS family permease